MQTPLDIISIDNKIKDNNIQITHSTRGIDMYITISHYYNWWMYDTTNVCIRSFFIFCVKYFISLKPTSTFFHLFSLLKQGMPEINMNKAFNLKFQLSYGA